MELSAQIITADTYQAFIQEKNWAAILVDTEWDIRGRAKIEPTFRKAIKEYHALVSFGRFDPEIEVDLAHEIDIRQMPTVLYYRKGELVAALISASQNVPGRIKALIDGREPGYHDGNDIV
jgi:thioredoxin-like negative regulator of GroEL